MAASIADGPVWSIAPVACPAGKLAHRRTEVRLPGLKQRLSPGALRLARMSEEEPASGSSHCA